MKPEDTSYRIPTSCKSNELCEAIAFMSKVLFYRGCLLLLWNLLPTSAPTSTGSENLRHSLRCEGKTRQKKKHVYVAPDWGGIFEGEMTTLTSPRPNSHFVVLVKLYLYSSCMLRYMHIDY